MECSRHRPDLSTIKTLNKELRIQILLWQLQSLKDCEWFCAGQWGKRGSELCVSLVYNYWKHLETVFTQNDYLIIFFKTMVCKSVKYFFPLVFYNLFFIYYTIELFCQLFFANYLYIYQINKCVKLYSLPFSTSSQF